MRAGTIRHDHWRSSELPAQEELRALLDYNSATGELRWKARPTDAFAGGAYAPERMAAAWNTRHAGKPALNSKTPLGYRHGPIHRRKFYAHRVIWKMVHGADPEVIDHINGDPGDNRVENLRNVSQADNLRNSKLRSDNSSGRTGVDWHQECGKWRATICVRGQQLHLGLFTSIESAKVAREAAEKRFGFHPNHGRAA